MGTARSAGATPGKARKAAPAAEPSGAPAAKRALRNQGRRTMRKLLDAAMVAFDRRGYHATRVNDVVELAKTSHGTFYLYFSNKEDLLRALVAEAAAETEALYESLATVGADGETGWQELRDWMGQYSALWSRYAPLLRAWTDLAGTDPELRAQVRDTMGSLSGVLSARIAAVPHHQPVDPDAAGLAVLAMLERFHYLREFMGGRCDDSDLDTLTTFVHRALFTPDR